MVSFDENLNRAVSEVLETESPIRSDYYVITLENGKELKLTDEHPLYIKSGKYEGWGSIMPEATMDDSGMRTRKIKIGDYILNIDKKRIKITNVKEIPSLAVQIGYFFIMIVVLELILRILNLIATGGSSEEKD